MCIINYSEWLVDGVTIDGMLDEEPANVSEEAI
jgi:hypothetical protein